MRGEENILIVHGAWCTRSNGSLLLVCASPESIEKRFEVTKFELYISVFEFALYVEFGAIYVVSRRRQ